MTLQDIFEYFKLLHSFIHMEESEEKGSRADCHLMEASAVVHPTEHYIQEHCTQIAQYFLQTVQHVCS